MLEYIPSSVYVAQFGDQVNVDRPEVGAAGIAGHQGLVHRLAPLWLPVTELQLPKLTDHCHVLRLVQALGERGRKL